MCNDQKKVFISGRFMKFMFTIIKNHMNKSSFHNLLHRKGYGNPENSESRNLILIHR